MVDIPRNKLFDRWDTIPDTLREALLSDINSEFIWKTCGAENIPDERISAVAKVSGYVLLGFLHPEDVAGELKERIGLDPKTANSIEDALNKRIYAPLRGDIDKIYAPISKLEEVDMKAKIIPVIPSTTPAPTPIKKPTTLSDVGWSRTSKTGPGIQLTATASGATPVPVAPSPAAPAEPAPVMLHEDTTFKAAEKNAGFTLSKPGAGAEVHISQSTAVAAAPRPAVLEFGGAPKPAPTPVKATTAQQPSAVHYTELKLSLSAVPTADTGPRNINQVTTTPPVPTAVPIPKPPTPPAASVSNVPLPRPPQAPAAPKSDKPIVKDFL